MSKQVSVNSASVATTDRSHYTFKLSKLGQQEVRELQKTVAQHERYIDPHQFRYPTPPVPHVVL